MEATSIYGDALAEFLYEVGYQVSVVNPARIKGFAKSELLRTKTDSVDAALIARFCAAIKPSLRIADPSRSQGFTSFTATTRIFDSYVSTGRESFGNSYSNCS